MFMKLKEFVLNKSMLNELQEIRAVYLGAEFIPFKSLQITKITIAPLAINIDASLEEIKENFAQMQEGHALLDSEGKCRFLYIPDHANQFFQGTSNIKKLRRVHISYCVTLSEMTSKKKFDRYRATVDTSGDFEIQIPNNQFVSTKLHICKNCIKSMMSVHNNFERFGRYASFDLKNFAQTFSKNTPEEFENASPELKSNQYPPDWEEISRSCRETKQWTCEECKKNYQNDRANLDTHHINSIKSDCRLSNLKVLCKTCHKAQPNHGHY